MNKKTIALVIFSAICRCLFEFGSIIMVWMFLPKAWIIVLTSLFVTWQMLGFHLTKLIKSKETNDKDKLAQLERQYRELKHSNDAHIFAAIHGRVVEGCGCTQCRRIARENADAMAGKY